MGTGTKEDRNVMEGEGVRNEGLRGEALHSSMKREFYGTSEIW